MIQTVNAKINIGLHIIGRRADGYHELSTLFYPVGLMSGMPESPWAFSDILEITPLTEGGSHRFTFTGNRIDCPLEKNLVWRAVDAFDKHYQERTGLHLPAMSVHLEKHIPDGAGLGGGSADASFTLRMLNQLTGELFSPEELSDISSTLGADCPFFIYNRPCLAEGIGEKLTCVDLDLSSYWLVILKPSFGISTREAFSGVAIGEDRSAALPLHSPPDGWRESVYNDFETHLFERYPVLRQLKDALYESGACYAQMSGSGSAVYGIFSSLGKAQAAWRRGCRDRDLYTALMRL